MSSPRLKAIADDFPRSEHLGSVSGYQPKLIGKFADGKFVTGWTEVELLERFDTCADLVQQLIGYCNRKLSEDPALNV